MIQITPIPQASQVPIVHEVFGLATDYDTHEVMPFTADLEEMIQWLHNRVDNLAAAIASNEPWITPHLTYIDVPACNAELDNGQLTLCGLTLYFSEQ